MAQISDATFKRLVNRRALEEEEEHSKGIRRLAGFPGYLRCVEVVPKTHANSQLTVWTGEQDGGICIRRGGTGQKLYTIERKKDVHVTCMLCHDDCMWCGLSDGYLRVFDNTSYDLMYEVKQHSGEIRCMCAGTGHVFTGSTDWQIYQWSTKTFQYVQQYSGHQNSVLCLVAEGDRLYSGGDDYSIRCWDTQQAREELAPWPLVGHRKGVRGLVIDEVFLFSCSADGSMKVWNTQTGQLVKHVDQREDAITTLVRDVSARRVWASGVDGVIKVWDALTLQLVTQIVDHAGTSNLKVICRVNGMRAWSVSEAGVVKVWQSESDPSADGDADLLTLPKREDQLQDTIEGMRGQIITNYDMLERRKHELRLIEEIDTQRKKKLARAIGQAGGLSLRRGYYGRLLRWARAERNAEQRRRMAECTLANSVSGMRRVYFLRLYAHQRQGKKYRVKQKTAELLCATNTRGLLFVYLRNLKEYTKRWMRSSQRKGIAAALQRCTEDGHAMIFFRKWKAWHRRHVLAMRRRTLADSMLRNCEVGIATIFWNKLVEHAKAERLWNIRMVSTGVMLANNDRLRRAFCFRLWVRFQRQCMYERKQARSEELEKAEVHRESFSDEIEAKMQEQADLTAQHEEWKEKNADMRRTLDKDGMTEDQIDAALGGLDSQIQALRQEMLDLDQQLEKAEREKMELRQQSLMSTVAIDRSKPLHLQVDEVLSFLKAKAFHCDADFDALAALQTDQRPAPQKYAESLQQIKDIIAKENFTERRGRRRRADTFPADGMWLTVPLGKEGAEPEILSHTGYRKAVSSLRQLIFAYDTMDWTQRRRDASDEVVMNAGTLLDIVWFDMNRRGLGGARPERTGGSRRRARSASSRGSGSPGRTGSPRGSRRPRSRGGSGSPTRTPARGTTGSRASPRRAGSPRRPASSPTRGRVEPGSPKKPASPQRTRRTAPTTPGGSRTRTPAASPATPRTPGGGSGRRPTAAATTPRTTATATPRPTPGSTTPRTAGRTSRPSGATRTPAASPASSRRSAPGTGASRTTATARPSAATATTRPATARPATTTTSRTSSRGATRRPAAKPAPKTAERRA